MYKNLENQEIRRAARVADVPLWKVALVLHISEPTLTRLLRVPLAPDKEEQIMQAIESLKGGEE